MKRKVIMRVVGTIIVVVLAASAALAHITPPVVLVSDRDAVVGLLAGARRFFVREVRLSSEERQAIQKQWGWSAEEEFYRFYLGRDEQGRLVAATIFLVEFTIHGPVRVAVGIGPDGKVKGATVVELTEETYPWLKPLIDRDFTRDYAGRDSRGSFGLSERLAKAHLETMPQFYAQVVASLIQRGTILYEVSVLTRGGAV
jgi:Na+-translocating ferredoxin:NAD+ oxidoreductase RnfG subunit